jgi:hypothetical protein
MILVGIGLVSLYLEQEFPLDPEPEIVQTHPNFIGWLMVAAS